MISELNSRLVARLRKPELRLGTGLGLPAGAPGNGPAAAFDFLSSDTLDSRITFTRGSGATRINAAGLIETVSTDVARFDYDPVTLEPRGLLIEEPRTNLLLRSPEFNNPAWSKGDVAVVADSLLAPDGTIAADKLVDGVTSAYHLVTQVVSIGAGTFAASVYMRAAELSLGSIQLFASSPSVNSITRFDLANGSATIASTNGLTGVSATIEKAGGGWFRCIVIFTVASAVASLQFRLLANAGSLYTGDGASGLYMWGAQLEAGAFATSYIPTTGAQATRESDIAVISGANFSAFFNQVEGAVIADWDQQVPATGNGVPIIISDGTTMSAHLVQGASVPVIRARVIAGNAVQALLTGGAFTSGAPIRVGYAYKVNDFAFSDRGSATLTAATGTLPTVDRLHLGSSLGVGSFINGHIPRLEYYNRRLPNADLQRLTA